MPDSNARQVLSRLSGEEFVDRERELSKICSLIPSGSVVRNNAANALLTGAPRVGKSETFRQSFDRLFNDLSDVFPFYYSFRRPLQDYESFARDYLSQFVAQFIAFRRNDPKLIGAADEPLPVIARAASPEDYLWVRSLIDSFTRASQTGDVSLMARCAFSAPGATAAHAGLGTLVMMDNAHVLADSELRFEFFRVLAMNPVAERNAASYALTGLQRVIGELITPGEELFDRLQIIRVEAIGEDDLEILIRRRTELLGIEASDSTIELMIQQLNRDLFYTRAIIDAGTARGSLKTFMEFERVYTAEVLCGRIGHYFDAVFREVAKGPGAARAAIEALAMVIEAGSPVPLDAVTERVAEHHADAEELLSRLHSRELLDISYGFVNAPPDPVLTDYVRAKHRSEIAGTPRPVAGEELLSEKLKQSYHLMMTRFNRAIQSQLVELVSRFDYENVPESLFDVDAFDKRYRGMSRVQVRRSLDEEQERIRLPQIALVRDAGAGEHPGVQWRLFAASGFEGAIYSEANEVLWLIALINSKEPLDVETLGRIDQHLEQALRGQTSKSGPPAQVVRWYVSKEGFSAVASERLASLHAYRSTFSQLDLIQDYLTSLALGGAGRPASEFELGVPARDEAELIAARTAEQIARAADFDAEAINQIKTALIEACINAAEHGDSPDRKIYQRFAIDDDKLIITVSNKGKAFGWTNRQSTPSVARQPAKVKRGRGLQIIQALMDEVKFDRTDDGSRLVMTKYIKRPGNQ